jgi:hypothetical protein
MHRVATPQRTERFTLFDTPADPRCLFVANATFVLRLPDSVQASVFECGPQRIDANAELARYALDHRLLARAVRVLRARAGYEDCRCRDREQDGTKSDQERPNPHLPPSFAANACLLCIARLKSYMGHIHPAHNAA